VIFLLVYDTASTELLEVKEYDESARGQAMAELRRKQEALLHDLYHVEVGLFEAESRAMLERTHSRYFQSLAELRKNVAPERERTA
jgi:hypothetical protein